MTKNGWSQLIYALPLVPVACGLIAAGLFFRQGGFGGGHGDLDQAIAYLGLPAVAFLGSGLPVPKFLMSNDLLLIIWYPALLNSLFLWFPLAYFLHSAARLRHKR